MLLNTRAGREYYLCNDSLYIISIPFESYVEIYTATILNRIIQYQIIIIRDY